MGLSKKTGVLIWVAFHVALIALGLSVPWKVESDLYSVLPDSDEFKSISAAEKVLSGRTMRNVSVLFGHADFEMAKSAAVAFDKAFVGEVGEAGAFDETRLFVDENALAETRQFLFENRYWLQGESVRKALALGDVDFLQGEAMQKIYGGFSFADLSHVDEDPYLLGEQAFDFFTLQSPLMGGKFALRDGVLAATVANDGAPDSTLTYVMWSASLSEKVSAMASDGHVFGRMELVLDSLRGAFPGLKVSKSGVPFHSYESSKNAQSEVAWISGVSVALILILLLYVFRSLLPIGATLITIGVACFTALAFSWFIFGSIHVFTFVFGTSVIGVSIDYAIHFFTSWKSGCPDVRGHIFKSLILGFMTTELSYAALTFADFALLRQMAVFSLVGLASAFLTILFVFHALPVVAANGAGGLRGSLPTAIPEKLMNVYPSRLPKWVAMIFIAALIPGIYLLNIHTDMSSLYTMSDELKAAEILNAKLNNLGISANYFIVEGGSAEEVLQNEEVLTERLAAVEKDSLLKAHLATSTYIPSVKTQQKTLEYARRTLVGDSSVGQIDAPKFLTPESALPSSFKSLQKMLWIGEVNGKFYSAVLPLHVAANFSASDVARDLPNVYAVNKMQNINGTLTNLSQVSLMLVAVAYLVVFMVLVLVYKVHDALRIIRAPVVACLFIAAVFGYAGIAFNFFAIVGVILTLGIGIDYALFFKEGGRNNLTTTLAVMLSACTTVISFGSLAFSSFVPVATFGFATLLGIICCFVLSPFSRNPNLKF